MKLTLVSVVAAAATWAVAPSARAESELHLDDARGAVAFLLDAPGAKPGTPKPGLAEAAVGDDWDGSLGGGIARSLFWTYRFFLSSQDSSACGFTPSCSRFSQEVIEEHGFFEGLLATFDRLSRDSQFAAGFYPVDAASGLLRDPPEQYCLGCKR